MDKKPLISKHLEMLRSKNAHMMRMFLFFCFFVFVFWVLETWTVGPPCVRVCVVQHKLRCHSFTSGQTVQHSDMPLAKLGWDCQLVCLNLKAYQGVSGFMLVS